MSKKYSFQDYDKHLALKPGFEFWLVIIFFLRPFILKLTTLQMGRGQKSDSVTMIKEAFYPDDFSFFIAILAAIPVIPVLFAYTKRQQGASDLIKTFWKNGAKFLVAAAVLNIAAILAPLASHEINYINKLGWAQVGVAVGIIVFILMSERVKDAFADFPEDQDNTEKDK